ncbi:MAG: hypothetical protein BVN35_06085 [Proteobacteria bacterium ST_bin11]|nr:MAG: hypothetical protein BVN35_06085 [Proteobacteria bacterium ST_bin11]
MKTDVAEDGELKCAGKDISNEFLLRFTRRVVANRVNGHVQGHEKAESVSSFIVEHLRKAEKANHEGFLGVRRPRHLDKRNNSFVFLAPTFVHHQEHGDERVRSINVRSEKFNTFGHDDLLTKIVTLFKFIAIARLQLRQCRRGGDNGRGHACLFI